MKSINEYINEQQEVNEDVAYALGTLFSEAVFAVAVFISYKTILALLKGAIAVFNKVSIKDEINKLKEIKTQMAKLLSKYPDGCKKLKEFCKKQLSNTKEGIKNIFDTEDNEFLSKHLDFFEDKDKEEFINLYKSSQEIKQKALQSFEDENKNDIKSIK